MAFSSVVINTDWVPVYNSIVLTALLLTQVYLATAILIAQARSARERKLALRKELERIKLSDSGEHKV